MLVINAHENKAQVELSYEQMLVLNNALNEICNGLDIEEFQTRIGVGREYASGLLSEVRDVIKRMEDARTAND